MKEGSSEAGFSGSFRRRDIRKGKEGKVIPGVVGGYEERSEQEDNYAYDIIKHYRW